MLGAGQGGSSLCRLLAPDYSWDLDTEAVAELGMAHTARQQKGAAARALPALPHHCGHGAGARNIPRPKPTAKVTASASPLLAGSLHVVCKSASEPLGTPLPTLRSSGPLKPPYHEQFRPLWPCKNILPLSRTSCWRKHFLHLRGVIRQDFSDRKVKETREDTTPKAG